MRHPPPLSRSTVALAPRTRPTLLDVELAVVTPMFGGSVEPGHVDPLLPVRASTVRGHLRFWWRACRGHTYSSAATLFTDEAAIWGQSHTGGTTSGPSEIEVEVDITQAGAPVVCVTYERRQRRNGRAGWRPQWGPYPGYALFPFQGEPDDDREPTAWNKPPTTALVGIRFQLHLRAAPHVEPVRLTALREAAQAAVWAWITFGGVGARTRRGCGSLYAADPRFSPRQGDPITWLKTQATQHVLPGAIEPDCPDIPFLANSRAVLRQPTQGALRMLAAWRTAIDVMRDFRQGRGWPEPASLRNVTGCAAPNRLVADPQEIYFPRAELGLPIVFHFKDQDKGDPPDYSLEMDVSQARRMASPIILKPLAIDADLGYPMALFLEAPFIADLPTRNTTYPLRLHLNGGAANIPVRNPADILDQAKAAKVSPLAENDAGNARDAFLEFAKRSWRGEVREVPL